MGQNWLDELDDVMMSGWPSAVNDPCYHTSDDEYVSAVLGEADCLLGSA